MAAWQGRKVGNLAGASHVAVGFAIPNVTNKKKNGKEKVKHGANPWNLTWHEMNQLTVMLQKRMRGVRRNDDVCFLGWPYRLLVAG